MFDQTLLETRSPRKALILGYAVEGLAVAVLVFVPLIHTQALSTTEFSVRRWLLPAPPVAPATRAAASAKPKSAKHRAHPRQTLFLPDVLPRKIPQISDEVARVEEVAVELPGALPPGFSGGARGGDFAGIEIDRGALPPPPAPRTAKASSPRRIRAGGQVDPAVPIFQPTPEYPHLARSVRAEGTVRLEAVISTDGTIRELKVLNGHPLLVKAAVEAVSRWRYQPTLLNGEPVEVVMEIEVHFRLAG